jgi:hypothetical protein
MWQIWWEISWRASKLLLARKASKRGGLRNPYAQQYPFGESFVFRSLDLYRISSASATPRRFCPASMRTPRVQDVLGTGNFVNEIDRHACEETEVGVEVMSTG